MPDRSETKAISRARALSRAAPAAWVAGREDRWHQVRNRGQRGADRNGGGFAGRGSGQGAAGSGESRNAGRSRRRLGAGHQASEQKRSHGADIRGHGLRKQYDCAGRGNENDKQQGQPEGGGAAALLRCGNGGNARRRQCWRAPRPEAVRDPIRPSRPTDRPGAQAPAAERQ